MVTQTVNIPVEPGVSTVIVPGQQPAPQPQQPAPQPSPVTVNVPPTPKQ